MNKSSNTSKRSHSSIYYYCDSYIYFRFFIHSILFFLCLTALFHDTISPMWRALTGQGHNKTNQYKTICTRSLSQTIFLTLFSLSLSLSLHCTVIHTGFAIGLFGSVYLFLFSPQHEHLVQFIRMIDLYEAPHCANEQKWDNNSVWSFIRFLALFDKSMCACGLFCYCCWWCCHL